LLVVGAGDCGLADDVEGTVMAEAADVAVVVEIAHPVGGDLGRGL